MFEFYDISPLMKATCVLFLYGLKFYLHRWLVCVCVFVHVNINLLQENIWAVILCKHLPFYICFSFFFSSWCILTNELDHNFINIKFILFLNMFKGISINICTIKIFLFSLLFIIIWVQKAETDRVKNYQSIWERHTHKVKGRKKRLKD